jgi:5-methylcytosine-specific restriction protein B
MSQLTQDRRLVLYDADGTAYRPVRDGGTGRSVWTCPEKVESTN